MGRIFLNEVEVTMVEVVNENEERVAVVDATGNYTNVSPNELEGDDTRDVTIEFDRLHKVHMCLANLLRDLSTTDGIPGSELERYRKLILEQ